MAHARTHEIIPVAICDSTDVGPVPIYFFFFFSLFSFQAKEVTFVCESRMVCDGQRLELTWVKSIVVPLQATKAVSFNFY